ncbi:hypothetical protein JCM8097_007939 [Rhodosporidiobolus ruineniae]
MQFNRPDFDAAAFGEGAAPSSNPSAAQAGANSPHPSQLHTSAGPHPHHPHTSYGAHPHHPYPYRGTFFSAWSWPRFGYHPSAYSAYPAFPAAGGAPPPPPPPPHGPYPHPHPHPGWSRAEHHFYRRLHRSPRRFRWLPLLVIGGASYYGYKKLQREVRDVRQAVEASADPTATAVLAAKDEQRRSCHGWGHRWHAEKERRWNEWQRRYMEAEERRKAAQAAPVQVVQEPAAPVKLV